MNNKESEMVYYLIFEIKSLLHPRLHRKLGCDSWLYGSYRLASDCPHPPPNKDIAKIGRPPTLGLDGSVGRGLRFKSRSSHFFFVQPKITSLFHEIILFKKTFFGWEGGERRRAGRLAEFGKIWRSKRNQSHISQPTESEILPTMVLFAGSEVKLPKKEIYTTNYFESMELGV